MFGCGHAGLPPGSLRAAVLVLQKEKSSACKQGSKVLTFDAYQGVQEQQSAPCAGGRRRRGLRHTGGGGRRGELLGQGPQRRPCVQKAQSFKNYGRGLGHIPYLGTLEAIGIQYDGPQNPKAASSGSLSVLVHIWIHQYVQ